MTCSVRPQLEAKMRTVSALVVTNDVPLKMKSLRLDLFITPESDRSAVSIDHGDVMPLEWIL